MNILDEQRRKNWKERLRHTDAEIPEPVAGYAERHALRTNIERLAEKDVKTSPKHFEVGENSRRFLQ